MRLTLSRFLHRFRGVLPPARTSDLPAISVGLRLWLKRGWRHYVSSAMVACLSLGILASSGCDAPEKYVKGKINPAYVGLTTSAVFVLSLIPKVKSGPHAEGNAGSNGSQTGTAAFLGNFTTVTQPTGDFFFLTRAADCSLNLILGTDVVNGTASFTGGTANYERTLHQLAGLTTTQDVYLQGCSGPSGVGLSTRFGVAVARKTGAPFVLAGAAFGTALTFTAAHDLSSGQSQPLSALPNASGVTTADMNGDGNGDLLIVNAYGASSAFVSVLLGNGDGTFAAPVSYPTGGSKSVAAVMDDVNGDGKLDIIAVADDQTVSILTGKGDGTFNAAQSFAAPLPTSSTPTSTPIVNVITADVNGDGKKDIVGSNGLVLLGNGDGTFHAVAKPAFPFTQGTGSAGTNLAAGDVDKDGKIDLVLNNGSVIGIWKGNGDGTFRQGAAYTSTANAGYVTLTDLDGDGNLDIYSGLANDGYFTADDTNPASAYVLMGNGDGTFVGAPSAPAGYVGTSPLAPGDVTDLADVNGDGYPDLTVPATGVVNGQTALFTVELGSAAGIFTPAATITAPATVTFSVSEFTSPVTESTSNLTPSSYVVADVNGDGRPDVVYVSNYRGYAVYGVALGNGDGTFAPARITGFPQLAPAAGYDVQTQVGGLRIGDFNHDGKADLLFNFNDVLGGASSGPYLEGLGVLPGDGAGNFGSAVLTPTYNSATAPTNAALPTAIAITDVNQDGLPDVVAANSAFALVNGVGVTTSTVQIYLGKANGSFVAPTAAVTTTNLGQVAVTDLNKDGKPDIAALIETSASQAQLAIAVGHGDGTFAAPVLSNLAGGDAIRSSGLVAADFDGDGSTDLALLDANDFSGIFYGKGDGTFTSVPLNSNIIPTDLIALAAGGHAVTADLNKDGKPDILAGTAVLLNRYGTVPVVTQYATSTALTASATSINPGSSLVLTATVTGAAGSSGTPSGNVTFSDGTTTLGSAAADATGKATLTTTALTSIGSHTLTAAYGGNTTFTASTSIGVAVTVNAPQPAATTTMLAAAPASAVAGTSIVFTATVSSASGTPAGTVTFLDGTTTLGTGTLDGSGKATYSTSALAAGAHSVTASYAGTTTFAASQSAAVPVTVTVPIPADFTLSLSPSSATVTHGSSATTSITLTPAGGFSMATALSCSGAPAKAICTISPASVTPSGSANATATVTVTTNNATAQLQRRSSIAYAALSVVGLLALNGIRKRRRMILALLLLFASAAAFSISGCGGASNTTAPGSYTLTITATAGSISHATPFTLNVQ